MMRTSRDVALSILLAVTIVVVAAMYLVFSQKGKGLVSEPGLERDSGGVSETMSGDGPVDRLDVVEDQPSREERTPTAESSADEPAPLVDYRKQAFIESHSTLDRGELRGIWTATKAVHDELRDELYESEKALGLYQEVVFQYDPNSRVQIPKPADLPTASYIQQVISPGDGPGVEGVGVVWYVTLTKEEYPDLYQLRDELKWLSGMIGK